jgi:hypothetical protein
VAVDAAGNLLIADTTSNQVLAVPANTANPAFSVASGIPGNSLALDSAGNVYTASAANQVLELQRTQGTSTYNGVGAAPSSFSLLSTGNTAVNLSLTDPDTTNFALSVATNATCTGSASALTVVPGGACTFTSSFTPTARLNYTNAATFTGNAANALLGAPPTLEIVQVGNNAPFPVSVSLGAPTPSPVFVGNTVTLTVDVSSTFGNPSGTVTFSVDGTALTPATVVSGAASATVSGLVAGSHAIAATFASSDPDFANSTATPSTLTVQKNPVTALLAVQNTSPVYNSADSATVTLSASAGTPTGTVQFSVDGTASGSPVAVSSAAATYNLPVLTAGPHTIAASYSGDSTFATTPVSGIAITVTKAAPTVTWTAPGSIVYGTDLSATQLNATASAPGNFVYTPGAGTVLGVATQTLSVTFTPTDVTDYKSVTQTTTLAIAKQGSNTAVALGATSINPGQSVTLTATITGATSGAPTGTVTFLDGTAVLGTSPVAGGVATYATTALLSGSHVITANYSGDSNFAASSTTSGTKTVTVAPLDFTIAGSGSASQTIAKAGTPAIFTFQVAPTFGSYPGPVTFSVSGLPPFAVTTFSPASIPVNGGATTVTLTVQTTGLAANNITGNRLGSVALALLLLPLSMARRFRKGHPNLNRLFVLTILLVSSAAAGTAMLGCGTNGGQPKSYDLTITTTSGTVQHTSAVTLTVQ